MIADLVASALMVSASLLWTRTVWTHSEDDTALVDCVGACILANAAALLLWLAGTSPETAMQSWGLHAAGGSLGYFALTGLAQWRARAALPGLSVGLARWSALAYLGVGLASTWMTAAPV